jgi:hypothetical protein
MDIFDEIGHSFEVALETGNLGELLLYSSQSRYGFIRLLFGNLSDFERIINFLKILVELLDMLNFEMIEIANVVSAETLWDRVRGCLIHH